MLTIFGVSAFVVGLSFYTCAAGTAPSTALLFLIRRPLCELLIKSGASEVLVFFLSWNLAPLSDLVHGTPTEAMVVDMALSLSEVSGNTSSGEALGISPQIGQCACDFGLCGVFQHIAYSSALKAW